MEAIDLDHVIRKGKYDERARIRREQAAVIQEMRSGAENYSDLSQSWALNTQRWADRLEEATQDDA